MLSNTTDGESFSEFSPRRSPRGVAPSAARRVRPTGLTTTGNCPLSLARTLPATWSTAPKPAHTRPARWPQADRTRPCNYTFILAPRRTAQADFDRGTSPVDGCGHYPPRSPRPALRRYATPSSAAFMPGLPFTQAAAPTGRWSHRDLTARRRPFPAKVPFLRSHPSLAACAGRCNHLSFIRRRPVPCRASARCPLPGFAHGLGGVPGETVKVPPTQPVTSASLFQPPRPLPLHHQPNGLGQRLVRRRRNQSAAPGVGRLPLTVVVPQFRQFLFHAL